jgi:hypothetical protein
MQRRLKINILAAFISEKLMHTCPVKPGYFHIASEIVPGFVHENFLNVKGMGV